MVSLLLTDSRYYALFQLQRAVACATRTVRRVHRRDSDTSCSRSSPASRARLARQAPARADHTPDPGAHGPPTGTRVIWIVENARSAQAAPCASLTQSGRLFVVVDALRHTCDETGSSALVQCPRLDVLCSYAHRGNRRCNGSISRTARLASATRTTSFVGGPLLVFASFNSGMLGIVDAQPIYHVVCLVGAAVVNTPGCWRGCNRERVASHARYLHSLLHSLLHSRLCHRHSHWRHSHLAGFGPHLGLL